MHGAAGGARADRGVDRNLDMLTLYSATQMPHIVRTGLAGCLGLDQGQVRVIAPDVGGGFGYKGILLPEEVCAAWPCAATGRFAGSGHAEHLIAGANCREHSYEITGYAAADGELRPLIVRRSSIPAPIPVTRFRPVWRRRRSPASSRPLSDAGLPLQNLVGGDQQAADFTVSRSRAPACASPWNCCSTTWRAPWQSRRRRSEHAIWCARSRCRSPISPTSISIAATIPRPSAKR